MSQKMLRIAAWGGSNGHWPELLKVTAPAWDGVEDLDTYLAQHATWAAGTPPTAAEIAAKESDFDTAQAAASGLNEDAEVTTLLASGALKGFALVCADQFGMTPGQLKAAIKAKM